MTADALLAILVFGVVIHLVLAVQSMRERRAIDRHTALIVSVLTVWAEHWGEPAERVKPLLLRALGRP